MILSSLRTQTSRQHFILSMYCMTHLKMGMLVVSKVGLLQRCCCWEHSRTSSDYTYPLEEAILLKSVASE